MSHPLTRLRYRMAERAPLIVVVLGAFVIVALAYAWTAWTAGAAETCRGTIGNASYYGSESGDTTANGEHFHPDGLTVASRGLPFGIKLRITMIDPRKEMRRWYGKSVVVRVNDRGPFHRDRNGRYDRFLDLSRGAARVIGLTQSGVSKVCAVKL